MNNSLAHISILVKDYDRAIEFYTQKMGFILHEDTMLPDGKRWVRVAPNTHQAPSLLLARADNPEQEKFIGNQSGGRVFLFLYTDDFDKTYTLFKENGVQFIREPQYESYGTVAVFEDLYGNKWDLIQPAS